MIKVSDRQARAEEREFKKLQKIIFRKDKKALDRWTKKWLREERKEEKMFNKETKKSF